MKNSIKVLIICSLGILASYCIMVAGTVDKEREKPTIVYQSIDSVFYDSAKNQLGFYTGDSLTIYNVVACYYPQIDWNWFKKGYTPVFVTSVNGRSGDYIYSDSLNDLTR